MLTEVASLATSTIKQRNSCFGMNVDGVLFTSIIHGFSKEVLENNQRFHVISMFRVGEYPKSRYHAIFVTTKYQKTFIYAWLNIFIQPSCFWFFVRAAVSKRTTMNTNKRYNDVKLTYFRVPRNQNMVGVCFWFVHKVSLHKQMDDYSRSDR